MKTRRIMTLCLLAGAWLTAGCGGSRNTIYTTSHRLDRGLIIILPGIEGEGPMNHDIRQGLAASGTPCALPIYNWGRPIPGVGMLLNQMDFVGNRLAGMRIARMIEQYQDEHPGQPVYLVGHSGGGGVAVFAAEALKDGRKVDGLVLLSASIWAGYDLTKALAHSRRGIVNFYNKSDFGLLGLATTLTSNVDGMKGPSAGLIGFDKPASSDKLEKRQAYSKLHQVAMNPSMTGGNSDPHAAVTRPRFVSSYVAPWVTAANWPAGRSDAVAGR